MSAILHAKRLTRQIAGGVGLCEVDVEVFAGEVVVLLGRNDERRNVLTRLLCGLEHADSGELFWKWEPATWKNWEEAQRAGVGRVDEIADGDDRRTVSAWMWEGRELRRWGFKRNEVMRRETREFLDSWGVKLDERSSVGELSLLQLQWLALLRAVMRRPELLVIEDGVLDWHALAGRQMMEFFDRLKNDKVAVVIEAGSLVGLEKLADRVVVLRDGRNVGQMFNHELDDEEQLLRLMGGRDAERWLTRAPMPRKKGWVVMDVQGLGTRLHPQRVFGFDLSQGEIVALTGNEGAGTREVFRVLCGLELPTKGTFMISGENAKLRTVEDALASGFLVLPADRKLREKVLYQARRLKRNVDHGVWMHGCMAKTELDRLAELMWCRGECLSGDDRDREWIQTLQHWIGLGPGVMLLEEPTFGMDVLAKREWLHLMEKVALCGMAVMVVTRDPELLTNWAHRVLVMFEGDLMGVLQGDRLTRPAIQALAAGGGQKWLPVHG